MNSHPDDLSFNSQYGEEYEITLEYELQRQKEKNKILQERLRNKEIFIVEMKLMHSQMESLTEKCRQELLQQREKRQVLQNVTLRQYAETIAELQHKITLLENWNGKEKKGYLIEQVNRNREKQKTRRQAQEKKVKEIASKQKQQVNELLKNFASRFLQMYSLYSEEDEESLKRSLKSGWKWIKNVVKQWGQSKDLLSEILNYAQRCQRNSQACDPRIILSFHQEDSEQSERQQS